MVRWHFGAEYPARSSIRSMGVSAPLIRMGHPSREPRSPPVVWLAHASVGGADFWSDNTSARVRQKHWYAYQDGDGEAVMASVCGWYDGSGKELLEQDLVAALIPLEGGEHALEIQITLRPPAATESVELGKTNFGLLAVRVAKTVSAHFGGGVLTNSEARQGEEAVFGQPARWMDYSGPGRRAGSDRKSLVEGITYFDHPRNPRYPVNWHVRQDGWMGAAFSMNDGYTITADAPLVLRYLLHAHRGAYDRAKAHAQHEQFTNRPGFRISKSTKPHCQYEVARAD